MQAEPQPHQQPHPWNALLAGAFGGLIGSFAMSKFYSLLSRPETPSQSAGEDATVKAASAISQAILRRELTADEKKTAGSAVHYAFGMTMAALYGVFAEFRDSTPLGWGLPFGAAVWLGAHVITVPALGLSKPVNRAALAAEAPEFAAHLIYGALVEALRRSLRYPRRRYSSKRIFPDRYLSERATGGWEPME